MITVAVSILFLQAACGGKKEKTQPAADDAMSSGETKTETTGKPSRLEGSWEIMRAEGTNAEMNLGTIYVFEGNRLSFQSPGFTNPGTTEVTNNTFSFQADGNELKFMYDYRKEGDTLIVSMQKSNQAFYMVKK
jgi:hypothetical protein